MIDLTDLTASEAQPTRPRAFTLRVRLFGQFSIRSSGEWLPGPTIAKGGRLVRMLLCSPTLVAKHELERTFPSDLKRDALFHRRDIMVSGARCYLRKLLGGFNAVCRTRSGYSLHPDVRIDSDVAAFDRAYDDGTLEAFRAAVRLYGGGFLPGEHDAWALRRRAELVDRYASALARLAAEALECHAYVEAIRYARLLCAVDATHELAARIKMRCHKAMNLRSAAIADFEELRSFLKENMAAGPTPETRALYYSVASEKE